jgi:hypothetical protein
MMGEIGYCYGSEWHLLRWLGRHRDELNKRVEAEIGADAVRWLDFHFDARKQPQFDREHEGLDFLPEESPARQAWMRYWPQSGRQQNWDAVGIATIQGADEWLLVEAKAQARPGTRLSARRTRPQTFPASARCRPMNRPST